MVRSSGLSWRKALEKRRRVVVVPQRVLVGVVGARLIANPGCHTTTGLLPLIPLVSAGAIDPAEIIVDSKTGMSGAGRAAKVGMLFSEVSEGLHAYAVGAHRHTAEFDQELSAAAGEEVLVTFAPQLPRVTGQGIRTEQPDRTSRKRNMQNQCDPDYSEQQKT